MPRRASSLCPPGPGTRAICSTKGPINSLAYLSGKRMFPFPTAGRFLAQFGVVPVTLPFEDVEDVEVARQTGDLDGIAWSGITEVYTNGWSNGANWFLTNNISGAWTGHFFANMDRWNELPDNPKALVQMACDQSHYYRQQWYRNGEAKPRVGGDTLKLTTFPAAERAAVKTAAQTFRDKIAAESPTKAKIVEIFKAYNATVEQAVSPYR